MIEIIHPKDEQHWLELRTKVLTSTDIGALFGISPYITAYELWHRKKDGYQVAFEPNQRMKWGTRLQDAIATGIAEEQGFSIRRMDEFIQDSQLRIGSSFDFSIISGKPQPIKPEEFTGLWIEENGLLEIKNVDYIQYKKDWIEKEDGSIEAPLHIEIQCQHELLVSGRSFLYLGALIGGNDLKLIKRTPDEKIFTAIRNKSAEFWKSIDENNPPSPNFDTDAEFIKTMFSLAEPGKIISMADNPFVTELVNKYSRIKEETKQAEKVCDAIKAELLTVIGDAESVIGNGYKIDCGITGSSPRNFVMPAFRRFRVFQKKEK